MCVYIKLVFFWISIQYIQHDFPIEAKGSLKMKNRQLITIKNHYPYSILIASCILCLLHISIQADSNAKKWVGTWSTAPMLVEQSNMPPSPGLTNNTFRQIVRVSIGGDTVRLKFSNDFSTSSVKINSANIAVVTAGSAVNASTIKQLKFNGNSSVTMDANSSVISDPVAFKLSPRMNIAITIYFGQTSPTTTGHPGSRTTSYLLAGDKTTSADFSGAIKTEHWYVINGIDVWAPESAAAVAILGNSITDGRGSTTDQQNRWPDILSERLITNSATEQVGVLNLGIGGNCVLQGGLGPTGVSRFKRDILDQQGVRWVIIFIGVNDIGGVNSASGATKMADSLINAYKQMISDAHAKDMKVYGATIMAFKGNSYYNQYSESCRQAINKWIRTGGFYDSIIDFDKLTRSSTDTSKLGIACFQNDGLHPDAAGYKKMGESVNLNLFKQDEVKVIDIPYHKTYSEKAFHVIHRNGSAMLSFDLSNESFVSLKVYSLLGKEIGELAGRRFPSGKHIVKFKADNLVKGMYVYLLKVDNFTTRPVMVH